MLLHLCRAGGVVDFEAVREGLDPRILDTWIAYDSLFPLDDRTADRRAALVAACVVALATNEAISPDDFRCTPEAPTVSVSEDSDEDTDRESLRQQDMQEQALFR